MLSLLARFDITVLTTQPHKVQSKLQHAQLMEDRQLGLLYAASFGHDNVGDPSPEKEFSLHTLFVMVLLKDLDKADLLPWCLRFK